MKVLFEYISIFVGAPNVPAMRALQPAFESNLGLALVAIELFSSLHTIYKSFIEQYMTNKAVHHDERVSGRVRHLPNQNDSSQQRLCDNPTSKVPVEALNHILGRFLANMSGECGSKDSIVADRGSRWSSNRSRRRMRMKISGDRILITFPSIKMLPEARHEDL